MLWELAIGAMTCACCAARVEKISAVEQAGYTAALPAPPQRQPAGQAVGIPGAGFPGRGLGAWPFHRAAAINALWGSKTGHRQVTCEYVSHDGQWAGRITGL